MRGNILVSLLVVILSVQIVTPYTCDCVQDMCTNIPANNEYYLTSFCDPSVACGDPEDCYVSYCADYKRFGCGSIISCCCHSNGNCTNLKVIDGGPACYVENDAGGPVIDASFSMCQSCTNSISCGWSDHIKITCTQKSFDVELTEAPEHYMGTCSYAPGAERPCVGELTPEMKILLRRHRVDFGEEIEN